MGCALGAGLRQSANEGLNRVATYKFRHGSTRLSKKSRIFADKS